MADSPFACGVSLAELRATEFSRLKDTIYLDNAGAAIPSEKQMRAFHDELVRVTYANPHSGGMASRNTTNEVNNVRERILRHFSASKKEYAVIFTSGATSSIKIIGESFQWNNESTFEYTLENHNSVLGVREYAIAAGASFRSVSADDLPEVNNTKSNVSSNNLFAFPAQCNFSGRRYPLELIEKYHSRSTASQKWFVLLDAASYLSTATLDLSKWKPDFVCMSFYKLFGFPTGLGALLVRRDSLNVLQKRYFGGGTVAASISDERYHQFRSDASAKFEDGTIDFMGIIALKYGFDQLSRLGLEHIGRHATRLSRRLVDSIMSMKHYNGSPAAEVYGNYHTGGEQGPIVAFSLKRPNGEFVGYAEVDKLANINGFQIRTGCFCNPGACQRFLGLSNADVKGNFNSGHVCWDDRDIINGKPTGAIRVSVPYFACDSDIDKFVEFIDLYFVEHAPGESSNAAARSKSHTAATLEKIIVYPIKSCGGFEVQEWPISDEGLVYDREWTLVDSENQYINQRRLPKLSQVQPRIELAKASMTLSAPGMQDLEIDLSVFPANHVELTVCGDSCDGLSYGGTFAEWFSNFLGEEVDLIRKSPTAIRMQKKSKGPAIETMTPPRCKIGFANESQFLVVNQSSIDDVETRMETARKISYENFRANFVLSGPAAFAEDAWATLVVGTQTFRSIAPCNRCSMVCVDSETGTLTAEPLLTLSKFRRQKGKILFGQHFVHDQSHSEQPFIIKTNAEVLIITAHC